MVYQGNGYGVFSYLKGYKFTVQVEPHTFTAAEGKQTAAQGRRLREGQPGHHRSEGSPGGRLPRERSSPTRTRVAAAPARGEEVAMRRARSGAGGRRWPRRLRRGAARADEVDNARRQGDRARRARSRELDAQLKPPRRAGPGDRRPPPHRRAGALRAQELRGGVDHPASTSSRSIRNSPAYPEALFYLADSLYLKRDYPLVAPLLREDRRARARRTGATRRRCSG